MPPTSTRTGAERLADLLTVAGVTATTRGDQVHLLTPPLQQDPDIPFEVKDEARLAGLRLIATLTGTRIQVVSVNAVAGTVTVGATVDGIQVVTRLASRRAFDLAGAP